VILMHDEEGHEDDWIYSEMHPKSEDNVGDILSDFAGLSLDQSFADSFFRAHISVCVSSDIKVPEGRCQCHGNSFAASSNGDIDEERIEIREHTYYYSECSILIFHAFSIRHYSIQEKRSNKVTYGHQILPKTLIILIGRGDNVCE